MALDYSPLQGFEGNKSLVFADGSRCVAAVAHRNFYNIAFVLINMSL